MNYFSVSTLLLALILLMPGCATKTGPGEDERAYLKQHEEWATERLKGLKDEHGWLSLAGLFWLKEGENSFGSDPSNDIVFPEKAEAFCGSLFLKNGEVQLRVKEGIAIRLNDSLIHEHKLNNDHEKNTSYLQQGDYNWYIVKRGKNYGIRLRDEKHPRINALDHIPAFPVQTDYVLEAKLKAFPEPRFVEVATPLEGFTETYICPGELHFELNGKDFCLLPFESGKNYFLVFADETSGKESYGAGRFMYARRDSTNKIILDFNKAYNPPCAFSPFATCPMPPRENILSVAIEAGEKEVHLK